MYKNIANYLYGFSTTYPGNETSIAEEASTTSLIVIISIGLALFLYLKKWKKEIQQTPEAYIIKSNGGTINTEELTFDSFQKKLDEEKKNSITAVYSTQKNEESLFFNPDKI